MDTRDIVESFSHEEILPFGVLFIVFIIENDIIVSVALADAMRCTNTRRPNILSAFIVIISQAFNLALPYYEDVEHPSCLSIPPLL